MLDISRVGSTKEASAFATASGRLAAMHVQWLRSAEARQSGTECVLSCRTKENTRMTQSVCLCVYPYTHDSKCVFVCVPTHVSHCLFVCMHMCVCVYIYIYIYIYIYAESESSSIQKNQTQCLRRTVHASCMCVYMYVCVCMYASSYICMCVCMYVCV